MQIAVSQWHEPGHVIFIYSRLVGISIVSHPVSQCVRYFYTQIFFLPILISHFIELLIELYIWSLSCKRFFFTFNESERKKNSLKINFQSQKHLIGACISRYPSGVFSSPTQYFNSFWGIFFLDSLSCWCNAMISDQKWDIFYLNLALVCSFEFSPLST